MYQFSRKWPHLVMEQFFLFPGGYENDCLLIRKGAGSYLMVSPTQQHTRYEVLIWLVLSVILP